MELSNTKKTLFLLLVALLGGAVGGFAVIWALLAQNLFGFAYKYSLLNSNIENRPVTIVEPREITLSSDIVIETILSEINKSTALLFTSKQSNIALVPGIYLPSEAYGQAVAVTSDGWFMTTSEISLKDTRVHIPSLNDGNLFTIERIVKDPQSSSTFFKANLSAEIRVARFAQKTELKRGETLIVTNAYGQTSLGTLLALNTYRDGVNIIRSSEDVVMYPEIGLTNGVAIPNAQVFTTNGELVALTDETGAFFNSDWDNTLNHVLRTEPIERPALGVHYILLSELIGTHVTLPEEHIGAWLQGDALRQAVKPNSPAALAGFVEGEILLAIEREQITKTNTIADLIGQYKPGDTVTIRFLDLTGDEQQREVTLDAF